MTVRELLSQVRDITQDIDSLYFTDSEMLNLFNECKRYISIDRLDTTANVSIVTTEDLHEYQVDNVIRFSYIKDSSGNKYNLYSDDGEGDNDVSGIIVNNYNDIYINNPKNDTLTAKIITLPEEDNLNDAIRIGDENLFKYYILSKAYEKDNDMEQFQKAQYFAGMFTDALRGVKKNSKVNYIDGSSSTKGYYY